MKSKFNIDKTFKYFPGNTVIHVINDLNVIKTITEISNEFIDSNLFEKFVFLPIRSYHMTVCDLITFNDLSTNPHFSEFIFKDEQTIEDIDHKIKKYLQTEEFELNVNLIPVEIKAKQILLKPKTKQDELKLNAFRSNLEEKLKIKLNPNYNFHISLSYQLEQLSTLEQLQIDELLEIVNDKYLRSIGTINVNKPILAVFNDMYEYRLLSKGRKGLGYNGNSK